MGPAHQAQLNLHAAGTLVIHHRGAQGSTSAKPQHTTKSGQQFGTFLQRHWIAAAVVGTDMCLLLMDESADMGLDMSMPMGIDTSMGMRRGI